MGNNNFAVKKIRRRNDDTFPILINSKEESLFIPEKSSRSNSYRGSMDLLEALLNNVFKCTLSEIKLGMGKDQIKLCKTFIKRYSNSGFDSDSFSELSKKFFGDRKLKPTVMFFKDIVELFKKTIFMYQFSYAHYILGKYNKMKDSFPDWCCGYSAGNVVSALWEAGVVSALRVANHSHDHSYVIIPFTVGAHELRGVIFIDPTSDQMFNKEKDKVRNLVRIITEENWEYKTDWARGRNLRPNEVEASTAFGEESRNYDEYIQEAFKNPVVVA